MSTGRSLSGGWIVIASSPVMSTSAPSLVSSFCSAARRSVLFHAKGVQAADRGGAFGEEGGDGESLCGVGHIGEVDVVAAQFARSFDGDEIAPQRHARAHVAQNVGEADVALERIFAQSADRYLRALMHGGEGEEVSGIAGVGLDRELLAGVDAAGHNEAAGGGGDGWRSSSEVTPKSCISRVVIATYGQLVCSPSRLTWTSLRA
jgi:hypothetical protein